MVKLLDIEEDIEDRCENKYFDFKYIPGNYHNPQKFVDNKAFSIYERGGN